MNRFKPAWWLNNSHLQTIFPVIFPRKIKLKTVRERLELPDNDFIDLDWVDEEDGQEIVLVLHGLGGSIASPYVQGILKAITYSGWKGALMHFRGCSGEPNRLPRSYHSGETEDLAFVVKKIHTRFPNSKLAIIGYSLGGNVLLKWLGEIGRTDAITCAIAVSVPFDLFNAVNRMKNGISQLYQWRLLRKLKSDVLTKVKKGILHIDPHNLKGLKNFRDFDEAITAPLHGFNGAEAYYIASSSRQYLKNIKVPTLIIHSTNDPFMSCASIPTSEELSDSISLELTQSGGHVGFISGKYPFKPKYWLEERIPNYLKSLFAIQS